MELAVGCVMCAAAARERGHGGDRAGASAVAMRELWEKTGAMQGVAARDPAGGRTGVAEGGGREGKEEAEPSCGRNLYEP